MHLGLYQKKTFSMNSSKLNPQYIIITKKEAWQIVLKAKEISNQKSDQKSYRIKVLSKKKIIRCTFSKQKKKIISRNFESKDIPMRMLEMYLKIIFNDSSDPYFIAHLAQSLDGFIATLKGESKYISSKDNLEHIHLLRCISDVIIVGSETVKKDNPKLTARLVKGENPMRIILDKNNEISDKFMVFSNKDGLGFKIISNKIKTQKNNVFSLPLQKGYFKSSDIVQLLKKLNKKIIFVEGGGSVISSFYKSNILDQLQICICPVILGDGISSFVVKAPIKIEDIKFNEINYHSMGEDILCNLALISRKNQKIESW